MVVEVDRFYMTKGGQVAYIRRYVHEFNLMTGFLWEEGGACALVSWSVNGISINSAQDDLSYILPDLWSCLTAT